MNDAEMLNWIQDNLYQFSQSMNEDYEMQWLNERGEVVKTLGTSIRDCVAKACTPQTN